jgi:hypothetical protein
LNYLGRAQTASAESLGALNLLPGLSTITITPGGTGVNSADLTVASLGQSAGAMVNFSSGTMGLIGNNPRMGVTAAPTLTNNILPWAVVGGTEFASYIPYTAAGGVAAGGIGALSQTGYAGYTQTLANTFTGVLSSTASNLKVTGFTGTVSTGSAALNLSSLNLWLDDECFCVF